MCISTQPDTNLPPQTPDIPLSARTWVGKDANSAPIHYSEIHEIMHRDISIGNSYRLERVKQMITLATGVFALTVTFHKDLFREQINEVTAWYLFSGWLLLLISLLWGVWHLRAWEDFYLQNRSMLNAIWKRSIAVDNKDHTEAAKDYWAAKKRREGFKQLFRQHGWLQTAALVGGLALIALYVALSGYLRVYSKPSNAEKPAVQSTTNPSR